MDLSILKCPITSNSLEIIYKSDFEKYNLEAEFENFGQLKQGLIDESKSYFYPIFNDIIILLPKYAYHIGNKEDNIPTMAFDKKRVFDYFNEINYKTNNDLQIYEDWKKWVDDRPVSQDYLQHCFTRASNYYPKSGKYILDIASGPVSFKEYMDLAEGYECRICIDISINALIKAKQNLEKNNKKGIFICGDITNIPLKNDVCDTVLSQHTLYHIPKNEQKVAVNELYRVAKPNSKL